MSLFEIVAVLINLTALFGYINHRVLRLEPSVGLLVIGLVTSLAVLLLDRLAPGLEMVAIVRGYVKEIDFNEALMHGMLGFLLFAGALHVDLAHFAQRKWIIGSLATVSLLISTVLVALLVKGLTLLLGLDLSLTACLVFGALISPTDPIAVMGTLKTLHAPPALEAKIAGESLFNDGVAVVVFTGLVTLLEGGGGAHGGTAAAGVSPGGLALFFLEEAGGGVALGLVAGYLAYRLMLSIDDYKVEVMITLALVMGAYAVADRLHTSGPIAVVCAGMLIGNRGRTYAMSEKVADYVEKFWEMIDEILNAALFLLIGIEVMVMDFATSYLLVAIGAVVIVLGARLVSVAVPISLLRRREVYSPGVIRILTWAGLRGGISVALVLSLPPIREKELLLTCTYAVVLFSILVQGLTIKRVLRRLLDGTA